MMNANGNSNALTSLRRNVFIFFTKKKTTSSGQPNSLIASPTLPSLPFVPIPMLVTSRQTDACGQKAQAKAGATATHIPCHVYHIVYYVATADMDQRSHLHKTSTVYMVPQQNTKKSIWRKATQDPKSQGTGRMGLAPLQSQEEERKSQIKRHLNKMSTHPVKSKT